MPFNPFTVSGVVKDVNRTVISGATVIVSNLRAIVSQQTTTNSSGEFTIDMANAKIDTINNDPMILIAYKSGNFFKFNQLKFLADTTQGFYNQDIFLLPSIPNQPIDISDKDIATMTYHPAYNAQQVVLRQPIPTDPIRNNTQIDITYDANSNPISIKQIIDGVTYTQTITWDANNNPTRISAWSAS